MTNYECQCCFNVVLSGNDMIWCESGHPVCNTCIKTGVEHAISEVKSLFTCPAQIGSTETRVCAIDYPPSLLRRAIEDPELVRRFDAIQARRLVKQALEDVETFDCPWCDEIIIIDEPTDAVHCVCGRSTCRLCDQDMHEGPCQPEEHRQDEQATDDLVMTCTCTNRFIRGDGCNHVTCNQCALHWCWICKSALDQASPYQHYEDGVCLLYGERSERGEPHLPERYQEEQQQPLPHVEDVQDVQEPIDRAQRDIAFWIQEAENFVQRLDGRGNIEPWMRHPIQVFPLPPLHEGHIVVDRRERRRRRLLQIPKCEAITIRGTQCTFRAKYDTKCGVHRLN